MRDRRDQGEAHATVIDAISDSQLRDVLLLCLTCFGVDVVHRHVLAAVTQHALDDHRVGSRSRVNFGSACGAGDVLRSAICAGSQ